MTEVSNLSVRSSQRLLALGHDAAILSGLLIITALYLVPFVDKGWIPHDDGMLGQVAERAMRGELPHVDFQDPYTGVLTWLHAGVFRALGVDLLWLRWALFACAIACAAGVYLISRRSLTQLGACAATSVAVVWSFPNYFASMPTWWSLGCTIAAVWCLGRFFDDHRTRWLVLAGLAAGGSLGFKQTGAYLIAAAPCVILFDEQADRPPCSSREAMRSWSFWLRVLAVLPVVAICLGVHLGSADASASLQLVLPLAAIALLVVVDASNRSVGSDLRRVRIIARRGVAFALGSSIVPLGLILVYGCRGHLWELWEGAFLLPQQRLASAALPPPPIAVLGLGAPMAILLLRSAPVRSALASPIVLASIGGGLTALLLLVRDQVLPYQFVWTSARALAIAAPVVAAVRIWQGPDRDPRFRRQAFLLATVLAAFSLVQFPFAAPIYFCYAAPLVVLLVAHLTTRNGSRPARELWVPVWCMFMSFGIFALNSSDVYNVGRGYAAARLHSRLNVERANIDVSSDDALMYGRLIELARRYAPGRAVIAGPDCPEVYFLIGADNPTPVLFDFFSGAAVSETLIVWMAPELEMAIINHQPQFTSAFTEDALQRLRARFPKGERLGRFEVRWAP